MNINLGGNTMKSRVKAIMEAYDCSLEEALKREDDVIVLDLDQPS